MANDLLFTLNTPGGAWNRATGAPSSQVVLEPVGAATADPDGNTAFVSMGDTDTARLFFDYTGAVTSATAKLWVLQDGGWSWGQEITLEPTKGASQFLDGMLIGKQTDFTIQITELVGTGTVGVRVRGVW